MNHVFKASNVVFMFKWKGCLPFLTNCQCGKKMCNVISAEVFYNGGSYFSLLIQLVTSYQERVATFISKTVFEQILRSLAIFTVS